MGYCVASKFIKHNAAYTKAIKISKWNSFAHLQNVMFIVFSKNYTIDIFFFWNQNRIFKHQVKFNAKGIKNAEFE